MIVDQSDAYMVTKTNNWDRMKPACSYRSGQFLILLLVYCAEKGVNLIQIKGTRCKA